MTELLIQVIEATITHKLQDKRHEILTSIDNTMPKHTFEHLVKLNEEVDEIVAELTKPPTEDDIAAKFGLCDNCD